MFRISHISVVYFVYIDCLFVSSAFLVLYFEVMISSCAWKSMMIITLIAELNYFSL